MHNPKNPVMNTTSAQSRIPQVAVLGALAASFLFGPDAAAARISEPDTVLYGRIVERVGDHHFLLTRGELVWHVRTTGPGGRELRLNTRLQALGDGRYSYQLTIPHDALAYDLAVRSKSLGLTAAGGQLQHLSITLDGRPLLLTPSAVDGFSVSQARRASTQRVDLETTSASMDSDGDGAPDWWEDLSGLDKFDPADAAPRLASKSGSGAGTTSVAPAAGVRTFAEWRAAWFPGVTGDLDAFGMDDGDRDGISNLLEYAFELDPTRVDDGGAVSLPRAARQTGRVGLSFRRRAGVTDLVYQVETSADLTDWKSGAELVEELSGTTTYAFAAGSPSEPVAQQFFRVRVIRKP